MSETVHYKGKLTPTGKDLYEYVEGDDIPQRYDGDKLEYFEDKYDDFAIIIEGKVFEITGDYVEDIDDVFKSSDNSDGSISFEVKYYNGGCGFYEAIEYAVENKVGK